MTEAAAQPSIVVGVDGSETSKDALRWAARQAELTGAQLEAVTVWQLPVSYGAARDFAGVDFAEEAEETLRAAVGEVLGASPRVPVAQRVIEGHPGRVLLEASLHAALLVVGSRGRGGFTGMLLGSVSQHCVQHAVCPVVVIRHPAPR